MITEHGGVGISLVDELEGWFHGRAFDFPARAVAQAGDFVLIPLPWANRGIIFEAGGWELLLEVLLEPIHQSREFTWESISEL